MKNRIRELSRQVHAEYKRKTSPAERIEDCVDLPQEVEEGNVEYKLQLLDPAPDRVKHLTTQLHWRLNEGKGEAFYEIGVRDNGEAIGISLPSMIKSIRTLERMCQVLNAELEIVRFRQGREIELRAARVRVTRRWDKKETQQLRVSVIGDFESGKSTLVGVLTRGFLDDGCGLARMQVFRHRHEIENGCTSSISEHTIGITREGQFCTSDMFDDCGFRENDAPEDLKSLITLIDLAGHKKYFKITASGLASQFPDYAMLVVDSARGIQAMTVEHIKIAVALEVAVFVVMTKIDTVPAERIAATIQEVSQLIRSIAPEKRIRCIDAESSIADGEIPLVMVSSVTGHGISILQNYFAALSPKRIWATQSTTAPEFQINKAFELDDIGIVVTGLVQSGTINVGESMLLGPDNSGNFGAVTVDSIEVQRKAVPSLAAGETGALLISSPTMDFEIPASRIRKGMMLIHPSVRPMATLQFDAEVHLLCELPMLKENYQAVVHAGRIRQMAKLLHVEVLEKSPRAICRFEFMYWPEYMRPDIPLVLREDSAFAVGKVVRAVHFASEHGPTSVRTC